MSLIKRQVSIGENIININLDAGENKVNLVGITNQEVKTLGEFTGKVNKEITINNTHNLKYIGLMFQHQPKINKFTIENKTKCMFDYFDQIYYINLQNRPERRENILCQLKSINVNFDKVTYIKACYMPMSPQIGCAISHMRALQDAVLNKYDKVLILEDDFQFTVGADKLVSYFKILDKEFPDWDVIQFSTINSKTNPTRVGGINRVIKADTTAGYGIKAKNITPLFNIFKGCLNPNNLVKTNNYAIDVAWQYLQPKLNWLIFEPNIGKQNESFVSDIENYRRYNWCS